MRVFEELLFLLAIGLMLLATLVEIINGGM
jgi:hypothetical protein